MKSPRPTYRLLLLLLGALPVSSQAQFIFTPRKPIQTLTATIDKHEGIQLKEPIPFSGIRIIDTRYDTTNIGMYLNGHLALKDNSQPLALQHVIDRYFHSLYTPGKDTLLIRLDQLYVQDQVIRDTDFMLTVGIAAGQEYTGKNGSYQYLRSFDTLIGEKFSYRTTFAAHKNGKHFNLEFWDYYLLRLDEAMITSAMLCLNSGAPDTNEYCTPAEIRQAGLSRRHKPILMADTPNHGFYRSFAEFVNNDPAFVYENADRLKKLLEQMHYRVGKTLSDEAPDTTWWGYCDGRNVFIRYNYDLYQLERRDAAYYVAPTLDARRREINNFGWNMVIGLATLSVGIAAKGGANFGGFSALPSPAIPMIAIPSGNGYILGLQLDWDTGKTKY